MKLGSFFSGYGGLDLALKMVFPDAETVWLSDVQEFDKKGGMSGNAPAILAERFPGIPNLGDITQIDWQAVEPVDIIIGGSPCFVAGTPVLTYDGLRPIEDVKVGDLVWTHAARWKRVTNKMTRTSKTVEFRRGFYCTPEHRLWLREGSRHWDNATRRYRRRLAAPEWIEAKDSKGMFAASPIDVTHEGVEKPDNLTWWQIGRFVADGYVNKQVNIYIGKGKEGDADMFPGWAVRQQETALCLTMPKSSSETTWLTKHFGKLAHGKTIPAFLLAETEDNRRDFLEGYWSGDGWKPDHGRFTKSNSVSACLTIGIELLAKSLGYTCTVSQVKVAPTKTIEGRTVSQRPWWMVRATPADGRFTEVDESWQWFKLRYAPKGGDVSTVYDLTVEGDHSFIAAGIAAHNCQDLSMAGRRAGMQPGTRSGLWESMFEAIKTIRPRLVVWENVKGALSAPAFSLLEPDEGCVGDRPDGPVLRALGRVLGDLSCVGYDAQWTTIRASDVGAPHHRGRVFVVAYPAGNPWRLIDGKRGKTGFSDGTDGLTLLSTPQARDHKGIPGDGYNTASLPRDVSLLPTPKAGDAKKGIDWGEYAPAITRWEDILGRPAPAPTQPGKTGKPQLSPIFVEWMMGLPEGWVTDIKISRAAQLRALGNGVVPQQAALAVTHLLGKD